MKTYEGNLRRFNAVLGEWDTILPNPASHKHDFSDLTNLPTTLASYGITDAYTRAYIDGITSLKSSTDNRSVATIPNDYNSKFDIKGLKQNTTIGITSEATYSALLGLRGWTDNSGGQAHELAFDGNGKIFHRHGETATWGSWTYLIESDDARLTDSRNAKDVSTWAKAANKPTYAVSEITNAVPNTRKIAGLDLVDDITAVELTAAINIATAELAGSMSKEDKVKLDTLVTLLETGDVDELVNTIGEVLEIFQTYPEGTDILTLINSKETAFSKKTGFNKNFGKVTGTVAQGDDSRFTDSRVPLAHTHIGSDITDSNVTYFVRTETTGSAGVYVPPTVSGITKLYEGLRVDLLLLKAGGSTGGGCTLNINGLGEKKIYRYSTSRMTTHYGVNYIVPLVYTTVNDGGCWMLVSDTYDSTEDYNLRWQNNIIAGASIPGYKIIMQGIDGKFYPLTTDYGVGNTKTVSSSEFSPSGTILYYNSNSTISANSASPGYTLYESYYGGNLHYTANKSSGWTAYMPLYIKAKVNTNGSLLLDATSSTSWLVQSLPTTEDGFVYRLMGYMNDTGNTWRLTVDNPLFEFKDGKIRTYIADHKHTMSDITDLTSMTLAEGKTGTLVTNQLISAINLKSIIKHHAPDIGITPLDISNWNTSHGWGDHSSAGYLKHNGTVTMTGNLDMGSKNIKNVNRLYFNDTTAYIENVGSNFNFYKDYGPEGKNLLTLTPGYATFNGAQIRDIGNPVNNTDATTKKYVDELHSVATSSKLGLVKIGYTQTDKNYPVQLSADQMYVNVPWIDSGGTVTSVASGNGMDFTTITGSGTVTLGTPSTLTSSTTNSVAATSHTHEITNYALSGTAKQISVSGSPKVLGQGTTLSLPQDIATDSNVTFKDINVTNLTVTGTLTTKNVEEINVGDNIITLNGNETGAPSQNAGIEIERGTSTNTSLLWNEGTDRWTFTNDGSNFNVIPIPVEYTYISGTDITLTGTGNKTINQKAITRIDTANTTAPGHSGAFTVVDSVTSSTTGHITAINLKTVTLPAAQTLPTVNDGALTMAVAGIGLTGSATFTANQLGASSFTVTSDATTLATANTLVARDASGDIRANKKFYYNDNAYTEYNSTDKCIDFVFA